MRLAIWLYERVNPSFRRKMQLIRHENNERRLQREMALKAARYDAQFQPETTVMDAVTVERIRLDVALANTQVVELDALEAERQWATATGRHTASIHQAQETLVPCDNIIDDSFDPWHKLTRL